MMLVVSLLLYRCLAPKNWCERAGAGLVQGFVIALYAEMSGFRLTICLSVRLFGLDLNNLNASLWSTLLAMGEASMIFAMIIGHVQAFIGISLFIEGWREFCRAHQDHRLAADGLYSVVRHPQYTGLFTGPFGEGVVHWPTIFSVTLSAAILIAYTLLAYREEWHMVDEFGEHQVFKSTCPCSFLAGAGGGSSSKARRWGLEWDGRRHRLSVP